MAIRGRKSTRGWLRACSDPGTSRMLSRSTANLNFADKGMALLCACLIAMAASASAIEGATTIEVGLSIQKNKFFLDTACLTWGYYMAEKKNSYLLLPEEFNMTSSTPGALDRVVRSPIGWLNTMECPPIETLLADFGKILLGNETEIHVSYMDSFLPRIRSLPKGVYHHLHITGHVNITEEKDLFAKIGVTPLVITCEQLSLAPKIVNDLQNADLGLNIVDLCLDSHTDDQAKIARIGLHAQYFYTGGSSDVSAYITRERRHQGKWAGEIGHHIHGRYVDLLYSLMRPAWCFTYNDHSPAYDYMLTALIMSARKQFQVFCLFQGDPESPIAVWMAEQGVTLILHQPTWADARRDAVQPFKEQNLKHSHLYASKTMVVGTWLRIDIPIIHELQQFRMLLFTDSDVFFHRLPTSAVLRKQLPTYVSMAPEMQDMFPYNAGIMIMNIKNLRLTYDGFLEFILSNKHGMYFPNFGPGDQGAYNEYYEKTIRKEMLPKVFNAKPYQQFDKSAWIVHFHGPKPLDYYNYFVTGECRFGGMCRDGLVNGFCEYVDTWKNTCIDPVCTQIAVMCNTTNNMCQHSAAVIGP